MRILKVILLGTALLSCSDAEVTSAPELQRSDGAMALAVPVTRVKIYPYSSSVEAGKTLALTVRLWDANGLEVTGRAVSWSTNRPHVATVNSEGLVAGVGSGLATITASIDGQYGYAAINVTGTTTTPSPAPVAVVNLSPASATLTVGQTQQLAATTLDASNNVLTGRPIGWSTSNASVANVNGSGLVTAVAPGSATITASSEGQSGTSAITVNLPAPIPVASVSVTPPADTILIGETTEVSAIARDANGLILTGRPVTWSSSNGQIASVSSSGVVTGVAAGQATIVATVEGQTGSAAITVNVPPPTPVASVSVSPSSGSIQVGQTLEVSAIARDANGNVLTGRAVSWSSSNAQVAAVSGSGVVTGVAPGSATIVATVEGQQGSAAVTVTAPPPTVSTVTVAPATSTLDQGQTVQLAATARASNGTIISGQTYTWNSSNPAIATVNGSGLVMAVGAGSATITATTSGVSGTASVTVNTPTPPPPSSGGQVLFFSDWRNQLGTTAEAMSDGGKWNWMSAGAGTNGSIIEAPAGFSTHKILRVQSNGLRDGWIAPTVTTLGELPIGRARNYRWEHAFYEPALADAGQHPIQDGGAVSQSNWYLGTTNGGSNLGNGQWGIDYVFGGNASWPHTKFTLGAREGQYTPLQKGVVYRHEIQIVRISATQFRFHVWIYDAAGNLLYDDDDFHNRDGSTTLRTYVHTFNVVANTSIFLCGLNGIGNSPSWPIHSSDQAAFAVVQGLTEGEQIGPYGSVAGEIRR